MRYLILFPIRNLTKRIWQLCSFSLSSHMRDSRRISRWCTCLIQIKCWRESKSSPHRRCILDNSNGEDEDSSSFEFPLPEARDESIWTKREIVDRSSSPWSKTRCAQIAIKRGQRACRLSPLDRVDRLSFASPRLSFRTITSIDRSAPVSSNWLAFSLVVFTGGLNCLDYEHKKKSRPTSHLRFV